MVIKQYSRQKEKIYSKKTNTIRNKDIKISIAELADLAKILELQKEAYILEAKIYDDFNLQPLVQDIDSLRTEWETGIVIKAEKNGLIVGSVRAKFVDKICKIGKLIVKPEFQNQGIGKRLMAEIEKQFDNCSAYELFTGNKSEKNLALYHRLSYINFKEELINNNLKLIFLQKQNNRISKIQSNI